MASVYKRIRRRPVPKGAEIVKRRAKRFAVWQSRGRRRRGELTDDGQAVLVEADTYSIEYFDHENRRRRKGTRIADKDAAQQWANRLETEAMQRREGLIDATQERLAREGRRPLQEHVADFRQHLHAKGNTSDHVALVSSRLHSDVDSCEFERFSDLTASTVQAVIAGLRDKKSLRTGNGYLRAVKGFGRWAWHDGRLAADPLATLQAYNEQTDRRRVRRAISVEEFSRLLHAAETGSVVEAIPGPARSVMYVLSSWTGYRR